MHLELTPEALLSQFGYQKSEPMLKQMENIINNTNKFNAFSKHLLSLQDNLAHVKGYIAMSNSENYLKIKRGEELSAEIAKEYKETIINWADKYKIELQNVKNTSTYYILGYK
ncbi:MAG TPA: hypothetical protein EYP02_01965 [Sulfurovum sp.]|nr:hypothetical protein [Sulfurovum sp.]HIM93525.1 hypothetical protein [Campylobacterales bacterium]